MKQLRLLTILFDTQIQGHEIPAFRGALAQKVGLEHDWFHNHKRDESAGNFHHRYPRIQYKRHRGKPMLVCLENGVEEVHKYFSQPDWTLHFSGKDHHMKIEQLRVHEYNLQVMDTMTTYSIRNWLAVSDRNVKEYKNITSLKDRITFLERKLANNIIGFAKGIDWRHEKRFEVSITDIPKQHRIRFKGMSMMAFNCVFQTNVFLPNYVGLGKGASKGYGVVMKQRVRSVVGSEQ